MKNGSTKPVFEGLDSELLIKLYDLMLAYHAKQRPKQVFFSAHNLQ